MKNNFLLILSFLVLFGCAREKKPLDQSTENSIYNYNFSKQFAAEMKKKYNINLNSYGGNIYFLSLGFQVPYFNNQEQARKLVFNCAEECLKRMNSDPRLKTTKNKQPHEIGKKPSWGSDTDFDYSNIKLLIEFKDDHKEHSPPNISFVNFEEGVFYYFIRDRVKETYVCLYRETIEQALEKLSTSSIH